MIGAHLQRVQAPCVHHEVEDAVAEVGRVLTQREELVVVVELHCAADLELHESKGEIADVLVCLDVSRCRGSGGMSRRANGAP